MTVHEQGRPRRPHFEQGRKNKANLSNYNQPGANCSTAMLQVRVLSNGGHTSASAKSTFIPKSNRKLLTIVASHQAPVTASIKIVAKHNPPAPGPERATGSDTDSPRPALPGVFCRNRRYH